MARLTVAALAERARVAPNTIVRIEADKGSNAATVQSIRIALESEGIRFTENGVERVVTGGGHIKAKAAASMRGEAVKPDGTVE